MIGICNDCATNLGCTWPEGHMATWWYGKCGRCGQEKIECCAESDWDWPDDDYHGDREI